MNSFERPIENAPALKVGEVVEPASPVELHRIETQELVSADFSAIEHDIETVEPQDGAELEQFTNVTREVAVLEGEYVLNDFNHQIETAAAEADDAQMRGQLEALQADFFREQQALTIASGHEMTEVASAEEIPIIDGEIVEDETVLEPSPEQKLVDVEREFSSYATAHQPEFVTQLDSSHMAFEWLFGDPVLSFEVTRYDWELDELERERLRQLERSLGFSDMLMSLFKDFLGFKSVEQKADASPKKKESIRVVQGEVVPDTPAPIENSQKALPPHPVQTLPPKPEHPQIAGIVEKKAA